MVYIKTQKIQERMYKDVVYFSQPLISLANNSQAKLETLEAIIKEVEGKMKSISPKRIAIELDFSPSVPKEVRKRDVAEEIEFRRRSNPALSDLLTKLQAEKEKIEKE